MEIEEMLRPIRDKLNNQSDNIREINRSRRKELDKLNSNSEKLDSVLSSFESYRDLASELISLDGNFVI